MSGYANREYLYNFETKNNKQQISKKINALAEHMDEIASNMVDFARVAGDDWKEVLQHAFQLHGAAYAAKSWADGILEER